MRSHSAPPGLSRNRDWRNDSQHVESNTHTRVLHAVDLSHAMNNVARSFSEFRPEDNTNDEFDAAPEIADGGNAPSSKHAESEVAHSRGYAVRMSAPSVSLTAGLAPQQSDASRAGRSVQELKRKPDRH